MYTLLTVMSESLDQHRSPRASLSLLDARISVFCLLNLLQVVFLQDLDLRAPAHEHVLCRFGEVAGLVVLVHCNIVVVQEGVVIFATKKGKMKILRWWAGEAIHLPLRHILGGVTFDCVEEMCCVCICVSCGRCSRRCSAIVRRKVATL